MQSSFYRADIMSTFNVVVNLFLILRKCIVQSFALKPRKDIAEKYAMVYEVYFFKISLYQRILFESSFGKMVYVQLLLYQTDTSL